MKMDLICCKGRPPPALRSSAAISSAVTSEAGIDGCAAAVGSCFVAGIPFSAGTAAAFRGLLGAPGRGGCPAMTGVSSSSTSFRLALPPAVRGAAPKASMAMASRSRSSSPSPTPRLTSCLLVSHVGCSMPSYIAPGSCDACSCSLRFFSSSPSSSSSSAGASSSSLPPSIPSLRRSPGSSSSFSLSSSPCPRSSSSGSSSCSQSSAWPGLAGLSSSSCSPA
mmetsp:Transcript_1663/g.4115  ORF Transcript_1663/g.4115 Transcript_1663/m.4115 type:complete len:222 (-) Transcript_1663:87-752(-)